MSEGKSLPADPHPDWYRKAAKKKLEELRAKDPGAKLAEAQLAVAREHGFPSWRKLIAAIEARRTDAIPAFFDAIRRDDYDKIRSLLKSFPRLAEARTPEGQTALHLAAEIDDPDTIRILLAHGADAKARYGDSSHTALSWAVTTNAYGAAAALVEGGAEPDLFCAAGLGDVERVRAFFDANGKVKRGASRTGSSRFTPDGKRLPCPPTEPREIVSDALYIASRNGKADVVRYLLDREPDLRFRGYLGATPLHWAYFGRSKEVVEMLLAAGADPDARDPEYGCTPRAFGITVAASWGILPIVVGILQADPSLARVVDGRGTPLHEAAREGHDKVVQVLLALGADRQVRDRDGKSPLDLATEAGHEAVVALLR
jgi:ankyrin repeat protein